MGRARDDVVVAYGDSQTAGFSWGHRLPILSETITTAIGRGVSGQEAGSVAVRQGGIVLTITAACTIPTTGEPVDIAVSSSVTPCNMRYGASELPVIIAGVRGVLTVTATQGTNATASWDRSTGRGTLRFTPTVPVTADVVVDSGTVIHSQDVVDHPQWSECIAIIWVGGNDAAFARENRVTGVVAAVQAMVDHLHTTVDNPRFLVAGRTTGTTNVEGTTSWKTAVDQRDALAAAFPDNAIDIWGHVRDHGLQILGLAPTEADRAALAGKTVPPSLTSDGLHFTTQTRERVLAPFIISELTSRGWTTPSKEDNPVVEYQPTQWENEPSTKTPLSADNLNNLENGVQAALEAGNAAGQSMKDIHTALATKADAGALDAKVTQSEARNTVYGISNGGKQYMYPTGVSTVAASTIAMRGAGGALKVGAPTADNHATTKKYVDEATPVGTGEHLRAGSDATPRLFAAKDIAAFVDARIAAKTSPTA